MNRLNDKVNNIIKTPGKKKILALDGGGTRGCITIEILACIEEMLRKELKKDDTFVLADYFDFMAGTSIGAIIGCFLSLGMPVARIRDFYSTIGAEMFNRSSLWQRWRSRFSSDNLAAGLKEVVGENTLLGTDDLKTLVMLVMRNATTDSPWPVTNNPYALYNKNRQDPGCNLNLPLWQLIRASTAAPTFFPPEKIIIGGKPYFFEDGAVSPYNNPAFLAFLQATVEPYNINWQTGLEELFIVSVGNGNCADQQTSIDKGGIPLLKNATRIPGVLLHAALNEQDILCRVFGCCLLGNPLDSEIGSLTDTTGPASPKLFTYLRYDFETSQRFLDENGMGNIDVKIIKALASVEHIKELQDIGKYIGNKLVNRKHYKDFLLLNTNHQNAS